MHGGWLAAFALIAVLTAPLAGQDQALILQADDGAGPFHAILRLSEAVRAAGAAPADVLRVARAELALGRPVRARRLLDAHGLGSPEVGDVALRIAAEASYGSEAYDDAARLFERAAEGVAERERAVLLARAGDAWERVGEPERAAGLYRDAANELPAVAPWLVLREARATADTSRAFGLLARAAGAAPELVVETRAELIATAGDTARAVAILAGAGIDGRAAMLALASRDSVNARQLAFRALRDADTAVVRVGVTLAVATFPPVTSGEYLALARAVRRAEAERAADLVAQAVHAGDSSAATLALWGDILADLRQNTLALNAYTMAERRRGPESRTAAFNRARMLVRLGRPEAASRALRAFADSFPEHPSAPMAWYLLADLTADQGRVARADTLFRDVARRWPRHEYAGQARFRLARFALARRDSAGAAGWYRAEAESRGPQRLAARFYLARLEWAKGETAAARDTWAELAREDSTGYYGAMARERIGLADPAFSPPESVEVAGLPELERAFTVLDFLEEAGFRTEAAAVRRRLFVQPGASAEELLDRAEGFTGRGYVSQGISLAWRAGAQVGLSDARVLRGIYPWPMRSAVEAEAREFGLDPYLLAAVIRQESNFEVAARSRAGARGLMQLMPGTARQAARRMGVEWDDGLLHVADANIHLGAAHLAALLRYYGGDVVSAVAAYNAGSTPVERWRRLPGAGDPFLFVERISYAETRGYIRSVLRNRVLYRALYPPRAAR